MGAWDSLMGVLGDVYTSTFGKSSIKTTMAFNNMEVARSVANSKAVSQFNGLGRTAVDNMKIGERVIKKGQVVRAGNVEELQNIINQESKMAALTKDDAKTAYETLRKYAGKDGSQMGIDVNGVGDADFQRFIGREGKEGLGPIGAVKGYFGDETDGVGAKRIKIAAGAVVGAGVATRYLQGGNLTTTAQGERNIAGIPFI